MNFKTHPKNLQDIKDTLDEYNECYFHGDGNIYTKNEDHPNDPWYDSNFRVGFTNPLPGETPEPHPSTFRVLFRAGYQIPETVEALNEMLLKAKMRQVQQKETTVKTGNSVKVLPAKKKVAPLPTEEVKDEETDPLDLFPEAEKPVTNVKNGNGNGKGK